MPEYINQLEGGSDDVTGAKLIPGHEGKAVITISNDRSVRVWLLRDSGQFWPSICHYMQSAASALALNDKESILVGTESGMISEFGLSEDLNRIGKISPSVRSI